MYIYGSYHNLHNEKISVYILTGNDRSTEMEIGDEEGDEIYFTDDPVEITSQVNDTFDHLLYNQASVRLYCKNFVPGLFSTTCRNAVVNIYRESTCVFAGYVEPQTYSQGYNEIYDEVELNCIDCLSALQYSNYRNIGAAGVTYASVKANASQRTFAAIVEEIVKGASSNVDILGGSTLPLYYDGSKTLDTTASYSIMDSVSINELLFLGDEEDDTWTQEDVLTEILKYLNLHIVQDGLKFYLFDWSTIRDGDTHTWSDIIGGGTISTSGTTLDVETERVADCDCQFSINETYNQLQLTDNVTEIESIVEDPMDSGSITYAFGNYQKYMTEYIAEGEGKAAIKAFGGMITGSGTDWSDASQVDWYMWVKKNAMWNFYCTDSNGNRVNVYDTYCNSDTNQQNVLSKCLNGGVGAALVAFGSVEKKNGGSDNSPAAAPDMKDYMVIGLHTAATATYPTGSTIVDIAQGTTKPKSTYLEDGAKLQAALPVAEYIGNTAGGTFSPADDDTTNYIQISGKLTLNPLMDVTAGFAALAKNTDWGDGSAYWHKTVPSRNNEDGRYYAQRFYTAQSWKDDPSDDSTANAGKGTGGVYPFTATGPQWFEFDYNAANEAKDTVSKVGVLQCMLIIGDKCVVETLPDNGGSGNGEPSDFTWQTYKSRSECADDDEYYAQSFAIGFDPKLKDKIIGTEFDIQKNASYTIGVTVGGTMIPIKKSDQVSGQVKFYILGAVNEEWQKVTKRHKTFFRHTKYYSDSIALLDYTSSIMVRDFEIKVVSDNGKVGAVEDENDIIYMSDTKETFVNKKDDLEFKITTALTSAECSALGVNNSVKMSAPQNETTGDVLLTIYDQATATAAKPEQLYVDAYWQEWHDPRVEMTQNFMDEGGAVSLFNRYRHPAIGKTFFIEGISRNLTEGTAEVTMKELF
jgi:hypothetical protein